MHGALNIKYGVMDGCGSDDRFLGLIWTRAILFGNERFLLREDGGLHTKYAISTIRVRYFSYLRL
jgi:hypothetical protein